MEMLLASSGWSLGLCPAPQCPGALDREHARPRGPAREAPTQLRGLELHNRGAPYTPRRPREGSVWPGGATEQLTSRCKAPQGPRGLGDWLRQRGGCSSPHPGPGPPSPQPSLAAKREVPGAAGLTRHIMKAEDLVHEGGGQDDLVEDRCAAAHHACVAPLWVHSQVPLVTVPGTHQGPGSGPSPTPTPAP